MTHKVSFHTLIKYRKVGRRIKDLGGYGYVYRPQGCSMMVDLEKLDEIVNPILFPAAYPQFFFA